MFMPLDLDTEEKRVAEKPPEPKGKGKPRGKRRK
jgi:hypothetical protein